MKLISYNYTGKRGCYFCTYWCIKVDTWVMIVKDGIKILIRRIVSLVYPEAVVDWKKLWINRVREIKHFFVFLGFRGGGGCLSPDIPAWLRRRC